MSTTYADLTYGGIKQNRKQLAGQLTLWGFFESLVISDLEGTQIYDCYYYE